MNRLRRTGFTLGVFLECEADNKEYEPSTYFLKFQANLLLA